MNERIRELAKESDLDWHKHWNDDESNRLEKFAELIVREFSYDCMDVTDMSHHIVFVAKKWGVEL